MNDDTYDDELASDGEREEEEEERLDTERLSNKPSLLCFLVDASKLMTDTHDFTPEDRETHRSYSIRGDVKSFYGLAMTVVCNACREQKPNPRARGPAAQVKKGLTDRVGVILYNCDSDESKESSGIYTLREIEALDCGFISTLDKHGRDGTYAQDSNLKAINLRHSEDVFSQKEVTLCHLLKALKKAAEMFHMLPGKTEARKNICVLTCCDDPIGGPVGSKLRLGRKKALLGRCNDFKDQNINIDVYPLQDEVTLDAFPPGADGPAPPPNRDVFRAGIVFKQMLTLAEVPPDTEAGKEVAAKCLEGDDDLQCAGEKITRKVKESLQDRYVGSLQDEIEARMLMMRSLGSIRWIIEWGEEEMRVGLKIYSLTSLSHSRKKTKVTARLREKVQLVTETTDADGNVLDNRDAKTFKKCLESYTGKEDRVILDPQQGDTYTLNFQKGIRLLALRKREDTVRPELNIRASQVMLPAEDDVKGSKSFFSAMWDEMLRSDLVAVCVAKLRAIGEPRLVALVPQRKDVNTHGVCTAPDCFYIVNLPYRDDIRSVPRAVTSTPAPPSAAVECARLVMNHMRLPYAPHPNDFPNPEHARYISTLEAISLKTATDQEEIEMADRALERPKVSDKVHDCVARWKSSVDADYDEHFEAPPRTAAKKRARDVEDKPPKEAKQPKKAPDPDDLPVLDSVNDIMAAKLKSLQDYCRINNIRVSGSKSEVQKRVAWHKLGEEL